MKTVQLSEVTAAAFSQKWTRLYRDAEKLRAERCEAAGIPWPLEYWPTSDNVAVVRLKNRQIEVKTASGIVLPTSDAIKSMTGNASESPYSVGLYLGAGPKAMDILESQGILPGDYVVFARFAGDEEDAGRVQEAVHLAQKKLEPEISEIKRAHATAKTQRELDAIKERMAKLEDKGLEAAKIARDRTLGTVRVLRLKVHDIHGSVDLAARTFGPEPTMEMVRAIGAEMAYTMIVPT